MDIIGIDVAKAKFDAALLAGERVRQSTFSNTEAGFEAFLGWLMRHRIDPSQPLHACLEATGNWGLDLADFLYAHGVQISIVNPARIKAYGASELVRNKTDRLPTPTSRLVGAPRRRSSDRPVLPCASTSSLDTAQRAFTGTARTGSTLRCPQGCSRPGGQPSEGGLCLTRRGSVDCCSRCVARRADRRGARRSTAPDRRRSDLEQKLYSPPKHHRLWRRLGRHLAVGTSQHCRIHA